MTAVDVDALDAARAAATPGKWERDGEYPAEVYNGASGDNERLVAECLSDGHQAADAALIVAMHAALPELLAEVRRGRALREAVLRACAAADGEQRREVTGFAYGVRETTESIRAVLAAADPT